MSDALKVVVDLLDLEVIEMNLFRGVSPDEDRQRVFGGQVAGQALVAAARTIDGFHVHSLHSYFLRPGDPNVPILYEVDRIRDGRSFATRRVVAIQHGKPIFNLAASFQKPEDGLEHQIDMPEAPDPDSLPDFAERVRLNPEFYGADVDTERAIDLRFANGTPRLDRDDRRPEQLVWMRANGALGRDPLTHTVMLTYASDMTLLDTATLPHNVNFHDPDMIMASLDHAMWFHRPFRMDEWVLYVQESQSASNARGITRGLVYTQDGVLVASVMQEGLMRRISVPDQS